MADPVIYEIKHTATGKVYVGSTNSWKRRLTEHRGTLRHGKHCNAHLQQAWSKYGESEFTFSVLEHLTETDLIIEREQYWIDLHGAFTDGFNMCPAAGTRRGVPQTAEHKAKISAAKMGHVQSESTRVLIRAKRATQVFSQESMEKNRLANTGKKRTAEFCARISSKLTGITRSPETRAKVAAANLGKTYSAEVKAKQSASMKASWVRRRDLLKVISQGTTQGLLNG